MSSAATTGGSLWCALRPPPAARPTPASGRSSAGALLRTALPAPAGFVAFVDALAKRIAKGGAPVAEAVGAPRVQFVTRGADTVGATVFGPDPRESDLTPATPDELHRSFPGARVLDEVGLAAERFAGTRRADVSGLLLGFALLLAAIELAVASMSR